MPRIGAQIGETPFSFSVVVCLEQGRGVARLPLGRSFGAHVI